MPSPRARPPVVLIPGLTCDERFWTHQTEVLGTDRNVVVPRLHDLDDLVGMARLVLDTTTGPIDVVGHSMGGRVAFEVVRLAPDRVRSLAVLDTGVHPPGENEPAQRQVRLDVAVAEGMDGVARDWVPMMVHPDRRTDADLLAAITSMVTSYTVAQYTGQIRALLTRPDARTVLARIDCPTLVACGRADAWSPLEQHVAIAADIRGARLEIIERAGHMVAMERPDRTTQLLQDWLRDVPT